MRGLSRLVKLYIRILSSKILYSFDFDGPEYLPRCINIYSVCGSISRKGTSLHLRPHLRFE